MLITINNKDVFIEIYSNNIYLPDYDLLPKNISKITVFNKSYIINIPSKDKQRYENILSNIKNEIKYIDENYISLEIITGFYNKNINVIDLLNKPLIIAKYLSLHKDIKLIKNFFNLILNENIYNQINKVNIETNIRDFELLGIFNKIIVNNNKINKEYLYIRDNKKFDDYSILYYKSFKGFTKTLEKDNMKTLENKIKEYNKKALNVNINNIDINQDYITLIINDTKINLKDLIAFAKLFKYVFDTNIKYAIEDSKKDAIILLNIINNTNFEDVINYINETKYININFKDFLKNDVADFEFKENKEKAFKKIIKKAKILNNLTLYHIT